MVLPRPQRRLYVLSGIAGIVTYNLKIRRFWQQVRERREAHEQLLVQDEPPSVGNTPRAGTTAHLRKRDAQAGARAHHGPLPHH